MQQPLFLVDWLIGCLLAVVWVADLLLIRWAVGLLLIVFGLLGYSFLSGDPRSP